MTVSSTTSRVAYNGNGTTTAFTVSFYFLANADLKVYVGGVLQTITTHYSVSGAGNPAGGTVTFVTAPITGTGNVVIYRDPALTQLLDYIENDDFPAESHEQGLDKLTMLAQRLDDRVDRAVVLADSYSGSATTVLATPAASKVIGWDQNGTALTNYSASDFASQVAAGTFNTQSFSGNGSTTAFVLSSQPASIESLEVFISGVRQTPTTDYTISATTLTFTTAPPTGSANIFVRWGAGAVLGYSDATAVNFIQAGTGAVTRSVQARLRETVSVEDFGAVGDGAADDTAAFNAAKAVARRILVPAGDYRLTSKFVLTVFGAELVALDGAGSVTITIDHTSGPGIVLANGAQKLNGLLIYASTTRRAAAVSATLMGVAIGGSDAGSNYLTGCEIEDCFVRFHPGIGVYMGAEGAGTTLTRVSSDYNKHHGFSFDDGTIGSSSPVRRCGIVTLNSCRAGENGGNGVNLSESNTTCYRFNVNQFEALSNAWNSAGIAGLLDAQAVIRGQNITISESGWDDALFANTTTAGGTARAAKGAAGDGYQIRNGATDIRVINNRHLTLTRNGFVRTGAAGVAVEDAYTDAGRNIGWRVETGVSSLRFTLSDLAPFTTPVYSDTAAVRAFYAGRDVLLGTATGVYFQLDVIANATIASNAVNAQSSIVNISGEGAAADDLQQISMAGGSIPVPAGLTVRVVNKNAYNITVKHGLTNIFTKTAADVVLGQNEGISFASDGTNMFEV